MVLGAEQFMGSSGELQECVVRGGAKLLVDGSLDIRQDPIWEQHPYHNISQWCWELGSSWGVSQELQECVVRL
jgi:hypothetical protein